MADALARAGGGRLLAVDVQPIALERAQERMRAAAGWDWRECDGLVWHAQRDGANVQIEWRLGCHCEALEEVAAAARRGGAAGGGGGGAWLVVFNLGYLPGGDKSIVTTAERTCRALDAAQRAVVPGGAVSATIYPGHEEGVKEEAAVLQHAAALPQGLWSVQHLQWLNQRSKKRGSVRAPSLLLLQRVHDEEV